MGKASSVPQNALVIFDQASVISVFLNCCCLVSSRAAPVVVASIQYQVASIIAFAGGGATFNETEMASLGALSLQKYCRNVWHTTSMGYYLGYQCRTCRFWGLGHASQFDLQLTKKRIVSNLSWVGPHSSICPSARKPMVSIGQSARKSMLVDLLVNAYLDNLGNIASQLGSWDNYNM